MDRSELIKRIKETAYLEGDFVLRSGKRSKYYLDKYLFETCPDILKALGKEFAKHVTDDVTLIAGAELGGVALARQPLWKPAKTGSLSETVKRATARENSSKADSIKATSFYLSKISRQRKARS